MNKLILSVIICFILLSCNSDDDTNSPLAGQHYIISSYRLDIPMDFNGDDQFSDDLLIETPLFSTALDLELFTSCLEDESLWFEEEGIACPFVNGFSLGVAESTTTGQLTQFAICVVVSCAGYTQYTINDNRIVFSSENEIIKEGSFIDDTITVTFSEEEIFPFEFLQSDGTILTYNGPLTIEYTLE